MISIRKYYQDRSAFNANQGYSIAHIKVSYLNVSGFIGRVKVNCFQFLLFPICSTYQHKASLVLPKVTFNHISRAASSYF